MTVLPPSTRQRSTASSIRNRHSESSLTSAMLPESSSHLLVWNRRDWLVRTSTGLLAVATPMTRYSGVYRTHTSQTASRLAQQGNRLSTTTLDSLEALAQQAVDAARTAGARYADTRVTRVVQHHYEFCDRDGNLEGDVELIGLGVRVLVDGYWGFTASSVWTADEAVRLAKAAVAQARTNAKGTPRVVDMGQYPVVTGTWTTPVKIDPFTVSAEEKTDYMEYWDSCCRRVGVGINPLYSYLNFVRQERILATSDGSSVRQTWYESGGVITIQDLQQTSTTLNGIDVCGKGWELFLDAKLPEQIATVPAQLAAIRATPSSGALVGRYTLVCDGATMASLTEQTFGIATQLDRALGYEANASGTSYLDDPLTMLGNLSVAASSVTVTANRSAPAQLATVKWDDEGVEPSDCTVVKGGLLTDFQTTREQATWLTPYYNKHGRPVRSHGFSMSEDASAISMQQMPNMTLESGTGDSTVDDLVANVKDGILVTKGRTQTDYQARNGIIGGDGTDMRRITNGRLGKRLIGGAVLFNTTDIWKHVTTVAGPATREVIGYTAYNFKTAFLDKYLGRGGKGQPMQLTSHSSSAPAAIILSQPLIDFWRKA